MRRPLLKIVILLIIIGVVLSFLSARRDRNKPTPGTQLPTVPTLTTDMPPLEKPGGNGGGTIEPPEVFPIQGGDFAGSMQHQNINRTYIVHVPEGLTSVTKVPLMLVFHGGNGTGEKVAAITQFNPISEKEKFIVAYPDGIKNNWNDGRGTTDAELAGIDDVNFVRSLVTELTRIYPINKDQIFATGVSNGGIFSHRLGCDASDVFSGIGPVIGLVPSNLFSDCSPGKAVGVVMILGDEDLFIPINGGETHHKKFTFLGDGGLVESEKNTRELWANINGCSGGPLVEALATKINDGTNVEKYSYTNCASQSVVSYIVRGMGHIWPPNESPDDAILGSSSKNLIASEIIWQFFKSL